MSRGRSSDVPQEIHRGNYYPLSPVAIVHVLRASYKSVACFTKMTNTALGNELCINKLLEIEIRENDLCIACLHIRSLQRLPLKLQRFRWAEIRRNGFGSHKIINSLTCHLLVFSFLNISKTNVYIFEITATELWGFCTTNPQFHIRREQECEQLITRIAQSPNSTCNVWWQVQVSFNCSFTIATIDFTLKIARRITNNDVELTSGHHKFSSSVVVIIISLVLT